MSPARRRPAAGSPRLPARRLRWLGLAVGIAALTAAALAGLAAIGGGGADAAPIADETASVAAGLPHVPVPAFVPGRPTLLSKTETAWRWATVRRATVPRARPAAGAAPVGTLSTETPEGTSNLVLVVGHRRVGSVDWLRVRLPVLPNNTLGWVPRRTLGGYEFVHAHLVVSLDRLSATLLVDGRKVFSAPVGVGASQWPTPTGEFYVRNKLTRYASPFYGPIAFGTSARSEVLTDWPDGGFIGIHGTSRPELIPGRVSHGCIRLRNQDILRLARLMPVGTPVTIR